MDCNKKYLIIGGYIIIEGDSQYLSPEDIIKFCGLNKDNCILINDESDPNIKKLNISDYHVYGVRNLSDLVYCLK